MEKWKSGKVKKWKGGKVKPANKYRCNCNVGATCASLKYSFACHLFRHIEFITSKTQISYLPL
ncbi:MAG: hypothetical protein ABFC98_01810 [Candidatus Cloacimonas sp.]